MTRYARGWVRHALTFSHRSLLSVFQRLNLAALPRIAIIEQIAETNGTKGEVSDVKACLHLHKEILHFGPLR